MTDQRPKEPQAYCKRCGVRLFVDPMKHMCADQARAKYAPLSSNERLTRDSPNAYLVTREMLWAEVERLRAIEKLYEAGKKQWDPVYKLVLDERDRLRAALEQIRQTKPYNRGTWHDVANRCHEIAREALRGADETKACVCGDPSLPGTHRTDGPCHQ